MPPYAPPALWFDVGIVRYTTGSRFSRTVPLLWFDVGIVRYTTGNRWLLKNIELWFDVGIVRYTTQWDRTQADSSCGLM